MKFSGLFNITRGTRVVLGITLGVCGTAVLIAFLYYRDLNRAEDPRMIPVRELIREAGEFSAKHNPSNSAILLDSALRLSRSVPGYEDSWEPGVIFNNMCSAWLISALYDSTLAGSEKEQMLRLAGSLADSSLRIYRRWIARWDSIPDDRILAAIAPFFDPGDPAFNGLNPSNIQKKRIRDIRSARIETPRRLSVSLTNLGTIQRHLNRPDSALACFTEALRIWDKNQTAKSNLSVLQGGKPVKRDLIQSLFPPDKRN
jgi:hypothetical protein